MRSCFEEFIKTNLMVQSEFNLMFWFVSYNIFFVTENKWGPSLSPLSSFLSLMHVPLALPQSTPSIAPEIAVDVWIARA
jgi:hypothetical protein